MTSPITEAKSSGAELPAAMNVAPATSSLRFNFCTTKTAADVHIEQIPAAKRRTFQDILKVGQRKN